MIISRDCDLARFGNLSQRFKTRFISEENDDKDKQNTASNEKNKSVKEHDALEASELEKLKNELEMCKKSKAFIENEYIKCEKELRIKHM